MDDKIRVLELYSGIGGMHFALKESGLKFEVVACYEINDIANRVYQMNFTSTNLRQRAIESLSVEEMNKLKIDLVVMSPPCQPFTCVGKKKDINDERTKSFLHFLSILSKLNSKPQCILLENVKGFDESLTRTKMLEVLVSCGYNIKEFLLTPYQFGIPNSRLRYYMLARISSDSCWSSSNEIISNLPTDIENLLVYKQKISGSEILTDSLSSNSNSFNFGNVFCKNRAEELNSEYHPFCSKLEVFLEKNNEEYFSQFLVPEKLLKRIDVMDIVQPDCKHSCCFTKRYGRYIESAGSVLQTCKMQENKLNENFIVEDAGLRFFTPIEIANLLCFPSSFTFPSGVSTLQQYRLLGNSLNVHCVSILLKLLYM